MLLLYVFASICQITSSKPWVYFLVTFKFKFRLFISFGSLRLPNVKEKNTLLLVVATKRTLYNQVSLSLNDPKVYPYCPVPESVGLDCILAQSVWHKLHLISATGSGQGDKLNPHIIPCLFSMCCCLWSHQDLYIHYHKKTPNTQKYFTGTALVLKNLSDASYTLYSIRKSYKKQFFFLMPVLKQALAQACRRGSGVVV